MGQLHKQWFLDRMQQQGLSLSAVAEKLGRDKSALSRALDGKRQFKAVEVGMIATLLDVAQEQVMVHIDGIAAATRGKNGLSKRAYGDTEHAASISPAGFGEEPQKDIKPSVRPRHPGFGFMKGQIKFADGFDGTEPYDDEPWDQGYLGEDRLEQQ